MNILIIEDDRDIAESMRDYLLLHGHHATLCLRGPAGLKRAQEDGWDAIVLDRMLPGLDGLAICRSLREQGLRTPVLMLTALTTTEHRVEGLDGGADDYLCKPFALAELQSRLDALHRRAGGQALARRLRAADLELDLDTQQARRAGKPLSLTPIGRTLLRELLTQRHRAVPHSELERAVWPSGRVPADALRVHMHQLREAVDRAHEQKLIATVHGVGYRLDAGG